MTQLPDVIANKSLQAKKVFLDSYTSAISKGLTENESMFAGIAAVTNLEKSTRKALEPLKPKVPAHLSAVLQKRSQGYSEQLPEPDEKPQHIKQAFLGKNALVPDPERSLVSADFNAKNQLVLQFDTGEKITTKPINVDETIESYVSISQANQLSATQEPTGFVNRTDSVLAFNNTTRTFSIAPASTEYIVWMAGAEVVKTAIETVVVPNTTGLYYIYFDVDDKALKITGVFTTMLFSKQAMVSIVYWQVDQQQAIYFADERHGMIMDGATHSYLHLTNGTVYRSGLGLTNITVDQTGALSAHAQLGVLDGRIADEDIDITIANNAPQQLSTIARLPVFYRVGSNNTWYKTTADNYPLLLPGDSPSYTGLNFPAYNYSNAGVWALGQVENSKFFLVHILATNNINEPVIAVLGGTYNTKPLVQSAARTELLGIVGLPFAEFLPVATVIYQVSTTYANVTKSRLVSTDTGAAYVDWREITSLSAGSGTGSVDINTSLDSLGIASDTLPTEFIVKQAGVWVRATLAQVQDWIDINVDGGAASSVYLAAEVINGGDANG
jgi:hypothetical protein